MRIISLLLPLLLSVLLVLSGCAIQPTDIGFTDAGGSDENRQTTPTSPDVDTQAVKQEIIEPSFIDYTVYRGYYYDLTENEQEAYRCIYNGIFSYPEKIRIPNVTQEELTKIYMALKYDNPHIIFLGSECSVSSSLEGSFFLPEYAMDSTAADANTALMMAQARKITTLDGAGFSDYALQLYLHDALCVECSYDENEEYSSTAYGALVKNKALCMGYSYAYKLLLDMSGFDSAVVAGSARDDGITEKHMWNVVRVNGVWYHTDVTWNDPKGQDEAESDEVRHCYFNLGDSEILLNHSIKEIPSSVKCPSVQENYYRREGLFCDNPWDANELISHTLEGVAANGDSMAEFRFNSGEGLGEVSTELLDNGKIYEILGQVRESGVANLDDQRVSYTVNEELNILIIFLKYNDETQQTTDEDMM